jgi:hypothetical protein
MGTALAVTQHQSSEAPTRSRERTHGTDRCPRCSGLMVAEWCEDLSNYRAQRCVQCGEIVDPVILRNRGAKQEPMTAELPGRMLPANCVTKGR